MAVAMVLSEQKGCWPWVVVGTAGVTAVVRSEQGCWPCVVGGACWATGAGAGPEGVAAPGAPAEACSTVLPAGTTVRQAADELGVDVGALVAGGAAPCEATRDDARVLLWVDWVWEGHADSCGAGQGRPAAAWRRAQRGDAAASRPPWTRTENGNPPVVHGPSIQRWRRLRHPGAASSTHPFPFEGTSGEKIVGFRFACGP